MKRFVGLGVVLAVLSSVPAKADVTARYGLNAEGTTGEGTLVEANEAGDMRITPPGSRNYALFTKDGDFLVWEVEGAMQVTRFTDFHALLAEKKREIMGDLAGEPSPPADPPRDFFRATGKDEVAGFPGIVYVPADDEGVADKITLSADPRLTPVGRAWARALLAAPDIISTLRGAPGDMKVALSRLFQQGAPLRMGKEMLVSANFADVPKDRLTLPSAPMGIGEARRLLMGSKSGNAN